MTDFVCESELNYTREVLSNSSEAMSICAKKLATLEIYTMFLVLMVVVFMSATLYFGVKILEMSAKWKKEKGKA